MPELDEHVALFACHLGGHGARANPGHVRLGDTYNAVDVPGTDPGAHAGAARGGVRGRDEGIGPVVEVEEGGLGTLEHDLLAGVERLVHEPHRIADHRRQGGRDLVQVLGGDLVGVEGEAVVDLGEDGVLLPQHDVELLAEDLRVKQVLHPQPDAGRLVRIGGPDAAFGGSELGLAEVTLGDPVELDVIGHHEMSVAGHHEAAHVDAPGRKRGALGEENRRLHHDAVADHGHDVVVEDPARDELQGEGLAAHDDRVTGVVTALVAHDDVHVLGEEVGELALPLVTPLGSDHHGRGHVTPPDPESNWAVASAIFAPGLVSAV